MPFGRHIAGIGEHLRQPRKAGPPEGLFVPAAACACCIPSNIASRNRRGDNTGVSRQYRNSLRTLRSVHHPQRFEVFLSLLPSIAGLRRCCYLTFSFLPLKQAAVGKTECLDHLTHLPRRGTQSVTADGRERLSRLAEPVE
jgi:hypothetical protein